MRILARQELQDIVIGAGLFGAGGGGSTAEGLKLVERALQGFERLVPARFSPRCSQRPTITMALCPSRNLPDDGS